MGIRTKLHEAIGKGNLHAFRTELSTMEESNFYNQAAEKRGKSREHRILRQPKNMGGETPFELAMSRHRFDPDSTKYLNMAREIADKDPAQLAIYNYHVPGTKQIPRSTQDYWDHVIKRIRAERNAPNNHEMKKRHETELRTIAKKGVATYYRRTASQRQPRAREPAQPQTQLAHAHAQSQAQLAQTQAHLQTLAHAHAQSQAQLAQTQAHLQTEAHAHAQTQAHLQFLAHAHAQTQAQLAQTQAHLQVLEPIERGIRERRIARRLREVNAATVSPSIPNVQNTRNRKKQRR